MNIEQQRAAFELYARKKAHIPAQLLRRKVDGYASPVAHEMWLSWQAAIELDQQGRGEPVGEVADVRGERVADISTWELECLPVGTKLYAAPQPADPTIKESLTAAEPVKEVSDEVMRDASGETWMGIRVAAYQYTRPLSVPGASKNATTTLHATHWSTGPKDADRLYRESDIRALLASYGKAAPPSVPEGWHLVPFNATKAMQDAWDAAPSSYDCDQKFHGAYAAMLNAAPTPSADEKAQQENPQ